MRTSSERAIGFKSVASAVMGLALLAIAATPAHAETVRDQQWHLDAMKADEIWKVSKGSGITVAVLDSGVDDTVPDLRGQVLKGKDFSTFRGDENVDIDNHGTGMAALIAANGSRGPAQGSYGLAPRAKILPVRIPYAQERWEQDGSGKSFAEGMSEAIRFAADSDAKIINISVASTEGGSPELTAAVKYALSKGKLIFAGVGNTGDKGNEVEYPAATPGVVGVAGVDKKAARWSKSQWGPQVDLSAPAESITNACTGGTQLCEGSGTSAATALASASAAVIWSKHPDWTNNQVLRVMLNTASKPDNGAKRSDYIGYGVVRPRIALKTPGDPGPANEYPLPDLAAAAPKSPSPDASKATGGTETDKSQPGAPESASKDDSNTGLFIALGIGTAVLIGAAVSIPLIRSRRRNAALPTVPPAAPAPYPYQTAQFPPSYGPPQGGAPDVNSPYGGHQGPGQPG
ncbi:type VII secretion-associated serine protease mycosin [Streptomyces sp. NBC_00879]|uniref:type VII secretion-associated serine protease mycosin n=1 Tax=Streptomyces sp. NBC_00879 TaxID=2975855 RepID=UPI00386998FA|nr:type VII secretion-associated serine protease mycosin [Streptomyces sp. NBC_00879]